MVDDYLAPSRRLVRQDWWDARPYLLDGGHYTVHLVQDEWPGNMEQFRAAAYAQGRKRMLNVAVRKTSADTLRIRAEVDGRHGCPTCRRPYEPGAIRLLKDMSPPPTRVEEHARGMAAIAALAALPTVPLPGECTCGLGPYVGELRHPPECAASGRRDQAEDLPQIPSGSLKNIEDEDDYSACTCGLGAQPFGHPDTCDIWGADM